jgi:transposase
MRSKYKITEEIRNEVKEHLKQERRVVVKERLTAVHMYINGMIQSKVAKTLGRSSGFVGVAVKNYFRGGKEALEEQRGGDRRSELTQEEKEELGYIIENSYPIQAKGWNGKIIIDLIEHKYGVKYKTSTVYSILNKLNISYKKAKKVDPKKSEEKIQ